MPDAMVAWLTGVLDEIQTVAGAARFDDPWSMEGDWDTSHVEDASGRTIASTLSEEITRHIALHDPRSVLARVEAERMILEFHGRPHECSSWNYGEIDNCCWIPQGATCSTVELLAYGHRFDAEGYDPAWAPARMGADAR